MKAWAEPIVEKLKPVAYGEVSPSGKGIKFWVRAKLPPEAKHKAYIVEDADAIEAYNSGRYFTVTGKGKGTIEDGQQVIDWLVKQYLNGELQGNRGLTTTDGVSLRFPSHRPTQASTSNLEIDYLNASEVIKRIRESRQSAKFDALMQGNITGYGSQSEADLALCGVIGFWTQAPAVIDAIFRQSALMRPKWDERHRGDKATYGQMTIEEALSGKRETYTPRRKPYSPTRRRLHRSQQFYGGRR